MPFFLIHKNGCLVGLPHDRRIHSKFYSRRSSCGVRKRRCCSMNRCNGSQHPHCIARHWSISNKMQKKFDKNEKN